MEEKIWQDAFDCIDSAVVHRMLRCGKTPLANMRSDKNVILYFPPDTLYYVKSADVYDLEYEKRSRNILTGCDDFKIFVVTRRFELPGDGTCVEHISYKDGETLYERASVRDPENYRFTADSILSRFSYAIVFDNREPQTGVYLFDSEGRELHHPDKEASEDFHDYVEHIL